MKKLASLFFAAAFASTSAFAQTWTGAGADNNWSTGANWSGGVAPASSATTQLDFPFGTPRRSPVVDAPWTVNRLSFDDSYALSGQAITLAGAGTSIAVSSGSTTVSNPIVLAAPATFTAGASVLTVNGAISGSGSLSVFGTAVRLAGANTYTGGTTVSSGQLDLVGSILGPVTATARGRLRGSGTVNGPVTVGNDGLLSPDRVLSTGNLSMGVFSGLVVSIDGAVQGSQYSTANVAGTVSLSGASLLLFGSYTPVAGDVFTIIANDGSDPVTGTFTGLPEGATVTFNGVPLVISYVGGTGNDVTLRTFAAIAPPAASGVPTLSEWALILVAAMLAGIGMLKSRRSR